MSFASDLAKEKLDHNPAVALLLQFTVDLIVIVVNLNDLVGEYVKELQSKARVTRYRLHH